MVRQSVTVRSPATTGAKTVEASPPARGEDGHRRAPPGPVAAGDDGERGLVEHGGLRDTSDHPPGGEQGEVRGEGDDDESSRADDASQCHDQARTALVEPTADEDSGHGGGDETCRERQRDECDRPAGGDGYGRGRDDEGVVQDSPADDLPHGQGCQPPAEPGRGGHVRRHTERRASAAASNAPSLRAKYAHLPRCSRVTRPASASSFIWCDTVP